MAPSTMLSSFPSWTSVSSLVTCVQLNLAVITAQFSYTKRRHAIRRLDSMSDGQIERRSKQVKRANLCLVGQFRQQNNYWRLRMARKFLHQPKIALHIIADELRVNPNRCGREIFESPKKNLRFKNIRIRVEAMCFKFGNGLFQPSPKNPIMSSEPYTSMIA